MSAKSGDVVKLARGSGILIDYETGFEISNKQEVKLGKTIGQRTHQALVSGGLVVVTETKKGKKAEEQAEEKVEE